MLRGVRLWRLAHVAELGFLVVHEKPSSLVPLGSVISQVPKAGARVLTGPAVLATVSLGPVDRIPRIATGRAKDRLVMSRQRVQRRFSVLPRP